MKQPLKEGLKLQPQNLDNKASNILIQSVQDKKCFQLVPPNMRQRNAAERAIQTFKNHFIAVICSVNPNLPLKLLERLLDKATTTFNMMLKSRINPNISSREQLFGIFNFNCTPFAPPGTRILFHDKPEKRATYYPHISYVWCIGRSPLNYRCFKCKMTSTKFNRTSDTVDSFPHHFDMPKTSS